MNEKIKSLKKIFKVLTINEYTYLFLDIIAPELLNSAFVRDARYKAINIMYEKYFNTWQKTPFYVII